MTTFLGKLAKHIVDHHQDHLDTVCVVLPSKRAGLFLKKEIGKALNKTAWLPEIISTDEFVEEISGLGIVNSTDLSLIFYKIYTQIPAEEKDNLDEFLSWAPTLLSDFDEVDRHQIDAQKLFTYVNEARALENWNVNGEDLTPFQRTYLDFWEKLSTYYSSLHDHLKSKNLSTRGNAYRQTSELIQKNLGLKWDKIIFAGQNALTKSEENIIRHLVRNQTAEVFWDIDTYYTDFPEQEAGHFIRQYQKNWNNFEFNWKSEDLSLSEKNIEIISCAQNIAQTQVLSDLVQRKRLNGQANSAIVLGDENLLLPTLGSLPSEISTANITMGLPIKQLDLFTLFVQIFSLKTGAISNDQDILYYYKNIEAVVTHPKFKLLTEADIEGFIFNIKKNNRVYIKASTLQEYFGEKTKIVFSNDNGLELLSGFLSLILQIKNQLLNDSEKHQLELEYLYIFHQFFSKFKNLIEEHNLPELNDIKLLRKIFLKLIRSEKISFFGEPLSGLQIMGMLETRAIDFDNVVIFSANEGIMPQSKSNHSFIPYDIRREFGLPTHTENDAIYAYHFYHLLQRAKNITICYNQASDDFGGANEKSRFITQIELEFLKINKRSVINYNSVNLQLIKKETADLTLKRSPEILEKLSKINEKGFSPSAFNTLLNCSLDYYYQYILGLYEKEEVEEKIENSTLGSAIHHALEQLYLPFVGKELEIANVRAMEKQIEPHLKNGFKEQNITEVDKGKNFLTYQMAINVIKNFLSEEIKFLHDVEQKGDKLKILDLEKELRTSIDIEVNGSTQKINLKGIADRIDQVGNHIRLIDYKTGKVEPRDLSIKNIEYIFEKKKGKPIQLLWYALLFLKNYPDKEVSCHIISFKKLSAGAIPLKLDGTTNFSLNSTSDFENALTTHFTSLFEGSIEFTHDENAKYCEYC